MWSRKQARLLVRKPPCIKYLMRYIWGGNIFGNWSWTVPAWLLFKDIMEMLRKTGPCGRASYLEVNKCAFTFSSEIRQIQCTRTEFWCVQCPRPAGPSALVRHQIQASALDLSYFTSKSKCKFINLIHTRQKNKIICSFFWKIINKMALKCH